MDAGSGKRLAWLGRCETFDHAIRKRAVLKPGEAPDAERDSHPFPQPHDHSAAELELARRALAAIPADEPLLHARIDMTTGDAGTPMIMEIELIDPVLFLGLSPGSAERYADAIVDRL